VHASSYRNMERFVDKYLRGHYANADTPVVLDVGSQDLNGSYRALFEDLEHVNWDYIGLDVCSGKNVDVVVDNIYHWAKIKSGSCDVVISGQTLEHVEFFWLTMEEVARVLKEGGLCCIIVPSAGPRHAYEGGKDCWRFLPDGLVAVAKYAKLEVMESSIGWESIKSYEDDQWKDSILVCRKPVAGVV